MFPLSCRIVLPVNGPQKSLQALEQREAGRRKRET